MALAGIKFDSDSGGFVSNCFPVRGLVKRDELEGDGSWFVAHRAEQRRRFKAVLCAKPRSYSRIREERKRTEDEGVALTKAQFQEGQEEEAEEGDTPVLDGYFLMKHCCVEDPADLCSVNIAGLQLSDIKEEDFEIFDSVAYINAGENFLPIETFRGFPALRELEMPLNGLRALKIQITDFPRLEVLDVSYNNLSHDDVLTLGTLPKLRVLHMTGNNFRTLPPDMSLPYLSADRKIRRQRFGKLEVLLLDDNKLNDIHVFAALAGLPKLRHINMEKNEIFCVPQLKCVEGRVVTHDGSQSKRAPSARLSARRSKSRQSGLLSARQTAKNQLKTPELARETTVVGDASETVPPTSSPVPAAETETAAGGTATAEAGTEVAAAETKAPEEDLSELLKDDFSLGDLGERIAELEEETKAVMADGGAGPSGAKGREEDYVPKVLPPFPELRYLNLAHNHIQEEDALLAVAAWPLLVHLVIHNNPLTTNNKGDPPLLKRFLSDRLGIKLQRKDQPRLVKPNIEIVNSKSRSVSDVVPKVPRSTIEERIQQLALEAPAPPPAPSPPPPPHTPWLDERALSGLDLETSKRMPLPPISNPKPHTAPNPYTPRTHYPPRTAPNPMTQAWTERREEVGEREEEGEAARPDSGTFFMTQVDGQDAEMLQEQEEREAALSQKVSKKKKGARDPNDDRYRGYELLLDDDDDVEMEVELPRDIQGNVRALKHALGHTLVYRDASVDLDRVKRTVTEYRRAPVPPPKPHKPKQEKIDELLTLLRDSETVDEETLVTVLSDPKLRNHKFPQAKHLLSQIQRRYNAVRVSSMKEAADARKIIDHAFEVLNKPKSTYTPSA